MKKYNEDPHIFKGIDDKYYVVKISLSGEYELFKATEEQYRKLKDDINKETRGRIEGSCREI